MNRQFNDVYSRQLCESTHEWSIRKRWERVQCKKLCEDPCRDAGIRALEVDGEEGAWVGAGVAVMVRSRTPPRLDTHRWEKVPRHAAGGSAAW